MTCVAGRVSKVQLSQRLDSLRVRPVGALASGEDLQRCSTSWENNFHSWQHSWQRQHCLVISTESPDSGNLEGAI